MGNRLYKEKDCFHYIQHINYKDSQKLLKLVNGLIGIFIKFGSENSREIYYRICNDFNDFAKESYRSSLNRINPGDDMVKNFFRGITDNNNINKIISRLRVLTRKYKQSN